MFLLNYRSIIGGIIGNRGTEIYEAAAGLYWGLRASGSCYEEMYLQTGSSFVYEGRSVVFIRVMPVK
jgi:hypothetical protein